jgi:uncharacterized peroxidase-related enzyme
MPHFPSLPDNAHLADLFRRFPKGVEPLMMFTDAVLRGDGALSVGERELIAAYVSGLNACDFCFESHLAYAELFGIEPGLVAALLDDLDTAPVPERQRALLGYVKRLNALPARLTRADAQAALDAGNSEDALYEAVQVSSLFNMMNRLVEGTGVDFDYHAAPEAHPAHHSTPEAHASSYAAFGRKLAAATAKDG